MHGACCACWAGHPTSCPPHSPTPFFHPSFKQPCPSGHIQVASPPGLRLECWLAQVNPLMMGNAVRVLQGVQGLVWGWIGHDFVKASLHGACWACWACWACMGTCNSAPHPVYAHLQVPLSLLNISGAFSRPHVGRWVGDLEWQLQNGWGVGHASCHELDGS